MNKLAVVICTFNKRDFVLDCIESVLNSDRTDFDIIVVDNASTDGSVDAIKVKYGEKLTLIAKTENTGGSGGFNSGMQEVLDRGFYKYFILMDNDITVKNDTISELRDYMDKHDDVGICGSAIFQMENPEITQEMGAVIRFDELTNKPLYHQVKADGLPHFVDCDYVPFCSAMIRTDILNEVGLIDTGNFIYWDDMEFCWRVRKAGYKVHAISSSVVYHCMSSKQYDTTFGTYYFFRNKLKCFTRHTSESEFELLPEIITKRLYRSIICNIDNSPVITTYMHALNDALNEVTGKADVYKIQPLPTDRNWHELVRVKSNILINYDPKCVRIATLLNEIEELCVAKITIATQGNELPELELKDISVIEKKVLNDVYDLEINLCYHVLDLDFTSTSFTEGQTIYYDAFGNAIATHEEYDTFKNYESAYNTFKVMMLSYITEKLRLVREAYNA